MIDRLVFGCGHLVAGAGQARANQLVSRCLDAGVRGFDTAPFYGLSTSETALGIALGRDGRAGWASSKAGFPRARFGLLKSYPWAIKRALSHATGSSPQISEPLGLDDPRLPRGLLAPQEIERSLGETIKALRGAPLAAFFLHEAYADNLSLQSIATLRSLRAEEQAQEVGIANGCTHSEVLDRSTPPDLLIQAATPPDLFGQAAGRYSERHTFHTVFKSFQWRCATDEPFRMAARNTSTRYSDPLGGAETASIALAYLLLAEAAPVSKFIYATSDLRHLERFLESLGAVARRATAQAIVEHFRDGLVSQSFDASHAG